MYSQILNNGNTANLDIFDERTGDYIGHSHFRLSSESERKLLELINYNRVPDTLTLLNVTLSHPSENYIPPEVFRTLPRRAVLTIEAIDAYSGKRVPIEIRLRYDVVARGNLSGSQYLFESIELSNIAVTGMSLLQA